MNNSRLDSLPVELIHHLLSYFSTHEIFYSFKNVTSYVNAILATYGNYRVNFKSISRNNFDLVCQHLIPDQVISLTLSDDENTSGLVDLFLSRFQIRQFTRLRALKLYDVGADFWKSIITQMVTLEDLRSFLYYPSDRSEPWICNLSLSEVRELDRFLSTVYTPILPRLFRLALSHGDFLNSVSFSNLRHLVLERTTIDFIKHLSSAAPHLKTLNTSFSFDSTHTEVMYALPELNRLILEIKGSRVSMDAVERMIAILPQLKHLELITRGTMDIVNGQRWEQCAKNLVTLNFQFYISNLVEAQSLDLFRTPFWMNEKRWFVACSNEEFFSVPYFSKKEADDDFRLPQYTTAPDPEIFYQNIGTLALTKASTYENVRYSHVQTLALTSCTSIRLIKRVIDRLQISNLALSIMNTNFPIKSLINQMPNLSQISITNDIERFLTTFHCKPLHKIQTLRIGNSILHYEIYNIEHLCTVFPNIKHLHVNQICSTKQIFDFLHQFKYLSTASFYCIAWDSDISEENNSLDIQSAVNQMRQNQGLNFTYRFDTSRIFFWI